MLKQNKILTHVLLWGTLYLFWIMVFQKRTFILSRTMTVEFCYLFFIAANFYFNAFLNIPRFLYQQHYFLFSFLFLAAIILGAVLRVPLASYLNAHFFIPGQLQPGPGKLFLNSFINIFVWTVCLVTGKLIFDRVRIQQFVETIQKEKSRAELDFLQAQFNPHFLFNSINSIYGNIDKNNVAARKMLLTFSEMLRYQLYECNTQTIPFDKELNYIKNYITLQQSRKEESLIVHFNYAENLKSFTIAPLLFVAFIENCFKYVSNHDESENRVDISFKIEKNMLVFRAFNTKEQNAVIRIKHKGIGITNVKRRLELLYPGRHNLFIQDKELTHEVILNLQLL
jgi:two-component system LytT family sensor kinase